ncbi:hypothetical protein PybrP1_011360 [[Pythium] brassicae (nom. inval.)]|nr:hypothetical protein PybrP1_011360 [[Pythium] brassicae (nom. inval.)]
MTASHPPQPSKPLRRRFSALMHRSSQVLPSSISEVDVYYGSLSGTAARLAAALARDVAARGVNTTLQSLEYFDPLRFAAPDSARASTRASVFVVSTHFGGSAPPNAEKFCEWLKSVSTSRRASATKEPSESTVSSSSVSPALSGPSVGALPAAVGGEEGECPLQQLLKWGRDWRLKRPDQSRRLADVQFAVFGVGSSEYLTFNASGKLVDARLRMLGATRLCALGLGDVLSNLDGAFLEWRARFLLLLPKLPGSIRLVALEDDLLVAHDSLQPQHHCVKEWVGTKLPHDQRHDQRQPQANSRPTTSHSNEVQLSTHIRSVVVDRFNKPVHLRFRCRVVGAPSKESRYSSQPLQAISVSARSVTVTRSRLSLYTSRPNASLHSISLLRHSETAASEVALARVALLGADLKYEVADTFGFVPHNCDAIVEQVAAALDFDLDGWIQLYFETEKPMSAGQAQKQQQLPFATPCTVRAALTHFLELNSVTREFVRVASGFVSSDSEREFLEALASTDGSADFADQIVKRNKGVLALLSLAPSLRIPFEVFVNIAPLIKPRLFCIATSPLKHPHHIELAVDLGPQDTKQGVTSMFLRQALGNRSAKAATCMLRSFIVRSGFKVPDDGAAPMILIASGVGIAPMRALLAHRRAAYQDGSPLPRDVLFYGCADRLSMLFADELFALEQEGFVRLRPAFSHDEHADAKRVQDVVTQHLEEIDALVCASRDSRIFVAGEAATVKSVQHALLASASAAGNENWFEVMAKSGRFVHEVC